jgi:hypothetical protein
VTVAVPALPRESLHFTMSVTLPLAPAVYAPAAVIVPPELFDEIDQLIPVPDPPLQENV